MPPRDPGGNSRSGRDSPASGPESPSKDWSANARVRGHGRYSWPRSAVVLLSWIRRGATPRIGADCDAGELVLRARPSGGALDPFPPNIRLSLVTPTCPIGAAAPPGGARESTRTLPAGEPKIVDTVRVSSAFATDARVRHGKAREVWRDWFQHYQAIRRADLARRRASPDRSGDGPPSIRPLAGSAHGGGPRRPDRGWWRYGPRRRHDSAGRHGGTSQSSAKATKRCNPSRPRGNGSLIAPGFATRSDSDPPRTDGSGRRRRVSARTRSTSPHGSGRTYFGWPCFEGELKVAYARRRVDLKLAHAAPADRRPARYDHERSVVAGDAGPDGEGGSARLGPRVRIGRRFPDALRPRCSARLRPDALVGGGRSVAAATLDARVLVAGETRSTPCRPGRLSTSNSSGKRRRSARSAPTVDCGCALTPRHRARLGGGSTPLARIPSREPPRARRGAGSRARRRADAGPRWSDGSQPRVRWSSRGWSHHRRATPARGRRGSRVRRRGRICISAG